MIAHIIEITDVLIKEGFLVTMDIKKAFDSLDHTFVISDWKSLDLVTILLFGLKS